MCTESLASDVTHVHMRVSFTVSHLNVFSCCKLKVYIAARSHASLGKLININNHLLHVLSLMYVHIYVYMEA